MKLFKFYSLKTYSCLYRIVKTSYQGGGSKSVFITLDEDQDIETKVENSKPVGEDATFTADELSELDI